MHFLASILALQMAQLPALSATVCSARGCTLPDHMGDIQLMSEFLGKARIPVRITSCKTGLLGQFSTQPSPSGLMTICTAALSRGVVGLSETFAHEMIHAAQFCKARNNGNVGFMPISDSKSHILNQSAQAGKFRHAGGAYGLLTEHEAYNYENWRTRDILYVFSKYCIDRSKR